jgi:hypothetical protein
MSSIADFIAALHASHLDNGRMVYYAAKADTSTRRSDIKPVMPATPFIFEYFLFNSIYQHDWSESDQKNELLSFPRNKRNHISLSEAAQQEKLLEYLKELCIKKPEIVGKAFAPFKHLVDLNGAWTKIVPDHNLDEDSGMNFFHSVQEIRDMLHSDISADALPEFFKHINVCREFVGKVRNNIFHGAKSLEKIWDVGQRRRIELYHLVIQSINSLFFLTRGMSDVAADEVCHPIKIPSLPVPIRLSSMEVLEMRVEGMMKKEDPELIPWARKLLEPLCDGKELSGAMFYPSAGRDIITPVLIGLPFCLEFYFYDDGSPSGWRKTIEHLCKILGVTMNQMKTKVPKHRCDIEFEYAGIQRRIFHVRAKNEQFLTSETRLLFFFRRGDGEGEGGSDQPWDGEWFSRWKTMIPPGRLCAVLTDGTPHGLAKELARDLTKHSTLLSTPHNEPYYCGIIRSPHELSGTSSLKTKDQ